MEKTVSGTKTRERNPQATRRDILIAAREEFVEYGLDGARVDRIAARAKALTSLKSKPLVIAGIPCLTRRNTGLGKKSKRCATNATPSNMCGICC